MKQYDLNKIIFTLITTANFVVVVFVFVTYYMTKVVINFST